MCDTGEGIKGEDAEQVFKAFYTTKPRGKGTGLGLSIARSILTEHGGDITLESEFGHGTTFSVWLPVYMQRMPFVKQQTQPSEAPTQDVTVDPT